MSVEQLYRDNYKQMVKRARGRVPNGCLHLAEEAVQETFTRLLANHRYLKLDNVEAILHTIMRNVISDMRQEERNRGVVRDEYDESELENIVRQIYPDMVYFDKVLEARAEVERRINLLSNEDHRYILKLFFLYSLTAKEVSQIVDSSYSSVRKIISRFGESWNK